jgi:two-component system sensor kinase FixL
VNITHRVSIKNKLVGIICLVTLAALGIGFTVVILSDIATYEDDLVNNTLVNARLVGNGCITALAFDDRQGAMDNLLTLESVDDVEDAYLFDKNGDLFAHYQRTPSDTPPTKEEFRLDKASEFANGRLEVTQPIRFKGQDYGYIQLRASTAQLQEKIRDYLATVLTLMAALMVLAFLLAQGLQRIISAPILHLARVTHSISKGGDYSVRVSDRRGDEIGILYGGFNEMLDQIEARRNERDAALEELAQTHAQLKSILRAASRVAIIACDENGRVSLFNSGAEQMLGYEPDEVMGSQTPLLWHLDEELAARAEALSQEFDQPIKGMDVFVAKPRLKGYEEREWTYVRKNGARFPVTATVTLVRDDARNTTGLLFVAIDITDRKRAEEEVRQSEQKYRAYISNSPFGVFVVNSMGQFIESNEALLRYCGYTEEELHRLNAPQLFSPNSPEVAKAHFGQLMTEGRSSGEVLVQKKDGSDGFYMVDAVRLSADRCLGFVADITSHKRDQEELKKFAARLERSNRELEDFASVASHDLQEPLRKVRAFGDRLKAVCGDGIPEKANDYLDRMQSAADRMQTLISDLLTFSRVTTKAQPHTAVDLNEVTVEVLSDLEIRVEELEARISIGQLPIVHADPLQMRQLLQNLIGNALKFHRSGVAPVVKVYTKAMYEPPIPHAAWTPEHQMCTFCVEDNGIGFEEKYADRIFTVFQRLHGRSEYDGTGVGLAVCQKIVERHFGKIAAESTVGKGSAFSVTLPQSSEQKGKDHERHQLEANHHPAG